MDVGPSIEAGDHPPGLPDKPGLPEPSRPA